jgi:hypothetical protein
LPSAPGAKRNNPAGLLQSWDLNHIAAPGKRPGAGAFAGLMSTRARLRPRNHSLFVRNRVVPILH